MSLAPEPMKEKHESFPLHGAGNPWINVEKWVSFLFTVLKHTLPL